MSITALAKPIIEAGIGKVISTVGTVIDNLTTTDEERGRLELAKLQIQLEAQRAKDEMLLRTEEAIVADQANLREQIKVELSSEDWFVRRARPAVLWIGNIILISNFVVGPAVMSIASIFDHQIQVKPIELPLDFWAVYGALALGYMYFRTREKERLGSLDKVP